jgi:hypothetical protein
MTRDVLAFPKPSRKTDPGYLAWIRRQPCVACGAASQAHHTTSKGAGGSDYRSVALCYRHHQRLHRMGRQRFQAEYGVDLNEEIIRLLEAFVSALRSGEVE